MALLLPLPKPFDYAVPVPLALEIAPGVRVWAPWRTRAAEGVVVAVDPPEASARLRPLVRLVDAPPVPAELMRLATWMADYYLAPLGDVLRMCLPAAARARSRRLVSLSEAGRRLCGGLDAVLTPVDIAELDGEARAILGALERGARVESTLEARWGRRALLQLVERGLVLVDERVRLDRGAEEVLLRPLREPAEGEFERAPRRSAVFARIAAAGELSLADLRSSEPRAAALVRALVGVGMVAQERREIRRDPFADVPKDAGGGIALNAAQAEALATIEQALSGGAYAPFLLHGVTGSGKTEVYLRAIATALAAGRTALVLVPEISLTPQLASRFRARFGDEVAVLHSALSSPERADAWRRIQRRQVRIVLGARSAVFAPLERLGVVVVDEEHDPSFKQEEGVRYHGRDVALVRARLAGAVALLGSATPALETYAAASQGRLGLLSLPGRATPRPLPSITILDLRRHRTGPADLFSAALLRALEQTLDAGEQAILFLNRRGFSTFVLCMGCGAALRCRDCSVALIFHRSSDGLLCHYCGFTCAVPSLCPTCGVARIAKLGLGTERVEALAKERFPRARVARLDRDTAQGGELRRVLDAVRARRVDILVGTQMIAKGHDFPGVTLVGVLLADHGMGLPDFRASERTFQLLEQVAGRAGRGERAGRVLVQTYNPNHPAVVRARSHDYVGFAREELELRRELGFPPSLRLACLRLDGADPAEVRRAAEAAGAAARAAAARAPAAAQVAVLGPAEAPLSRLKGRTRWQLFVKAAHARALRTLARAALSAGAHRAVRASVDIDPVSML